MCEIACVPFAEIAPILPSVAPSFGPEAQALFVETADRSATWIRANLPALPPNDEPALPAGFDIAIAKRNPLLEEQLHAILVGDGLPLWRRKRAEDDALTTSEREQVAFPEWNAPVTALQIRLTPAAVLHGAAGHLRRSRLRALADSAISRWVDRPPPGSTWEGESPCSGSPCGMGSVSPLARDFLRFYTTGS